MIRNMRVHRDGDVAVMMRERTHKRKTHLEVAVIATSYERVFPCDTLIEQHRLYALLCKRDNRTLILGSQPEPRPKLPACAVVTEEWRGFVCVNDGAGEWWMRDNLRVALKHVQSGKVFGHFATLNDTLALDAAAHFELRSAGTL